MIEHVVLYSIVLNHCREALQKCFDEFGIAGGSEENNAPLKPTMSKEQAIRIIQKNERGRQGMVRAKLMKELKDEEIVRRRLSTEGNVEKDPDAAAILIQKTFRGWLSRSRTKRQAAEELVFIGMRPPSIRDAEGCVYFLYLISLCILKLVV